MFKTEEAYIHVFIGLMKNITYFIIERPQEHDCYGSSWWPCSVNVFNYFDQNSYQVLFKRHSKQFLLNKKTILEMLPAETRQTLLFKAETL